jgi:hypothetical protein
MLELGSIAVTEPPEPATTTPPETRRVVLTTAELAECTCPDFCVPDHDVD